ncbi:glycosyl hydrolase family 16 [Pseudoalteromonas lipolytica SCSIO 04301]|uniref:glycoside hydrolase family 16 protein n=1 Tax=Pseudoalteromonas TaxID=53246 RepID=UPI00045216D8|nr:MULTISPECIES: glycoside hydrolase family 16 protein [Pseudoalteromonas]EWH07338.1 glycosyl hydrolase family 16 [Pseudoalteromonas lipolytica SCSIO 04301]QMW15746.1 family 16 glycosylhydrolase [Pseudoalteromonas sp. MT33b]
MNRIKTHITQLAMALSVATLAGCGGSATETKIDTINPSEPTSDWVMIWEDDFNGDSIDDGKWNFEVDCAGGGNNEKQCYTDSKDNAFVENGILNIVALPAEEGATKPYTSARLNTRYKADFKYGRFEMRAKLPSGQGAWPAFWMMPTDEVYGGWPRSGEIDIVEAVNLKVPTDDGLESNIYGTLHYGKEWPNNDQSGKAYTFDQASNPADDFHTYAIEWQEGEIRWYVDDYLYATQRKSELLYNASGEALALKHKGWYSEYFDQTTGELTTFWDASPYDQEFYLILNFAVGGDWPENVNATGIDTSAFENGQAFEIDYVRVYECAQNPDTGKGCETVRPGYDSVEDALVEGAAPAPTPPSDGTVTPLTIFDGSFNPNWPAWDCCGGSTPALVEDVERGEVVEFNIGAQPTVNGFISREAFITDENGVASPYDASAMLEDGYVRFDMQIMSLPATPDAPWLFKIESDEGSSAVEMNLNMSTEGAEPVVGEWQTFTFPLQALADAGLNVSLIDVIMIFPAWGQGEGAVYRVDNVEITNGASTSLPSLTLFTDETNIDWPLWDCCGGSTPIEVMDDEAHGVTAEFSIGAQPTVMGFINRTSSGGSGSQFDATALVDEGMLQFEMKVISLSSTPEAAWLLKVESDNGTTAVEVNLNTSVEGVDPVAGEWQTYTFPISTLLQAGLDVSAIDVIMIFPAWGQGEGAVYRVDNARIYAPEPQSDLTLFADNVAEQWSIWDCCAGSTPTVETDDEAHGAVAEFKIGATATVMGFLAADGVSFDASHMVSEGVVRFEMKLVSNASNQDAQWLFKIESNDAGQAVELALSASQEGVEPVVGEWQTYTYTLSDLLSAGLDISAIDVVMVFPSWGMGEGAVYRIDNAVITNP